MFKGILYPNVNIPAPVKETNSDIFKSIQDMTNIDKPITIAQTYTSAGPLAISVKRQHSAFVVRTDQYFIEAFGIDDGGSASRNLLKSTDGINWELSTIAYIEREGVGYTRHRDGWHYLINGQNSGGILGNVIRTRDGIDYENILSFAPFAYYKPAVFSLGAYLYVASNGKVWRSNADTTQWWQETWTEIQPTAPFGDRNGAAYCIYNGRMYIIGGYIGGAGQTDAWHSADGITWTQITGVFPTGRGDCRALVVNNKILVTGGYDGLATWYNDNYIYDGISWTTWIPATGPYTTRAAHGVVEWDGKLWFMGGKIATIRHDVYNQSIGTSYYLDGNLITGDIPSNTIKQEGYHEIITKDITPKLVRFCLTAFSKFDVMEYYIRDYCLRISNVVATPIITFERTITLTGAWQIEFALNDEGYPAGGSPVIGHTIGDMTNHVVIRDNPTIAMLIILNDGTIHTVTLPSQSQKKWAKYKIVAKADKTLDVYMNGVLAGNSGTVATSTTFIISRMGGIAPSGFRGGIADVKITDGDSTVKAYIQCDDADSFKLYDFSAEKNNCDYVYGNATPVYRVRNGVQPFNTDYWFVSANCTITSVLYSGNRCLNVNVTVANAYAYQIIPTVPGYQYQFDFIHTNNTTTGKIFIGTTLGGSELAVSAEQNNGSWSSTQHLTFTATTELTYIHISVYSGTGQTRFGDMITDKHYNNAVVVTTSAMQQYAEGNTAELATPYQTGGLPNLEFTVNRLLTYYNTYTRIVATGIITGMTSAYTLLRNKTTQTNNQTDMKLETSSEKTVNTQVNEILAKAGISSFRNQLGYTNSIDSNVNQPLIVELYKDDKLIDKAVMANKDFSNNYKINIRRINRIIIKNYDGTIIKDKMIVR